jgi:hypothetical protein
MEKEFSSKVIDELNVTNARGLFLAHVFRELMSKVRLLVHGEEIERHEPGSEADLKSLIGYVELIKIVAKTPNQSMKEVHEEWFEKKVKEGWVYGERHNEEKKTSPRILPYDQAVGNIRSIDKIFELSVRALLYKGE